MVDTYAAWFKLVDHGEIGFPNMFQEIPMLNQVSDLISELTCVTLHNICIFSDIASYTSHILSPKVGNWLFIINQPVERILRKLHRIGEMNTNMGFVLAGVV